MQQIKSVKLPPEMVEQLQAIADKEYLTFSQVLRRAVREYLERQ